MVGFLFQTDDGFILLGIAWKGHAFSSYRMIDDAVEEEGDIRHDFAHPRRVQSSIDGPLQGVGISDAFEKCIKFLAVGDENGFVQVPSAAIARGMIVLVSAHVLVPQNEPVTEIDLEREVCSWNMIFKGASRAIISSVVNL